VLSESKYLLIVLIRSAALNVENSDHRFLLHLTLQMKVAPLRREDVTPAILLDIRTRGAV
jgi:hypothetical protein